MIMFEEMINAVSNNDESYDGGFYCANKNTGTYCKPSCKHSAQKAEYIEFFKTTNDAEKMGYKPCMYCNPRAKYSYVYKTPIGNVEITSDEFFVTEMHIFPEKKLKNKRLINSSITDMAANELKEYLAGERQVFTVPLNPSGTEFQKQVWDALLKIPYGQTKTYKEIAYEINNKNACRAVGMANNKNPIIIFIPCHRVIGSDNSLTGYGAGIELKKKLLQLENCKFNC